MGIYIEFLSEIEKYIYENREKKIVRRNYPTNIHRDFELSIIGAIKQVFPNSKINLCLYRNVEINWKKIFGSIENQDDTSLSTFKRVKTLCYIDRDYVEKVFYLISEDTNLLGGKDKEFANSYLKKTYMEKYSITDWNYFKKFDHRTNNAYESYHYVLNSKFNIKPTI